MADDPQLYQIVYDDLTLATRDPDLEMLDNLDNLRPDWSEYWPIRRFLFNTEIIDTTYYGFFSPRFLQKTSILAKSVQSLLKDRTEDVVLFSPFLDQSALFLNQVEQGDISHPGLLQLFAALFPRAGAIPMLVQDTTTTIYSNFFVAKGRFWRAWLEKCEPVFNLAEAGNTAVGEKLCEATRHDGRIGSQFKVFCIERVAGLMLADDPKWTRIAPLAYNMPLLHPRFQPHKDMLVCLDLLKSAARRSGNHDFYLRTYMRLRKNVLASFPHLQRIIDKNVK
jgi:hypothetical protein